MLFYPQSSVYNKGNRSAAPIDLIPQFDLVRQGSKACGICHTEAPSNYEADHYGIAAVATMTLVEGYSSPLVMLSCEMMEPQKAAAIAGPPIAALQYLPPKHPLD
jgi:ferredoxin